MMGGPWFSQILLVDFNNILSKSFFPITIANMLLGQCVGHPTVEVDCPFVLPHEVMYHLITKQGMDVKRASCVQARVDQMLGT